MLLIVSLAAAEEFTVDAGEDWCAVVQAASPGDTVRLTLGEHQGSCTIEVEGLSLEGSGATLVSEQTALTVAASDVHIEGFIFSGEEGIEVLADGLSVRACQFLDLGGVAIRADRVDVANLDIDVSDFRRGGGPALVLGCEDGSCSARGVVLEHGRVDSQIHGFELHGSSFASIRGFIIEADQALWIDTRNEEPIEIVQTLVVGESWSEGGMIEASSSIFIGDVTLLDEDVSFVGNTVYGTLEADEEARLEANAALGLPSHSTLDVPCDDACFQDASQWDFRPTELLEGTAATAQDFCGEPQHMLGALAEGPPLPLVGLSPECPEGPGDSLPHPSDSFRETGDSVEPFDPFTERELPAQREPEPTCGCAGGSAGAVLLLLGLSLLRRRR